MCPVHPLTKIFDLKGEIIFACAASVFEPLHGAPLIHCLHDSFDSLIMSTEPKPLFDGAYTVCLLNGIPGDFEVEFYCSRFAVLTQERSQSPML